tara:strand:- start:227 stop:460 length:234 start_codon:yes stop_codon:yes gene_type:complete
VNGIDNNKVEILYEDLDLIANRIKQYSDPLDERIRRELQVQYQMIEDELNRLNNSWLKSMRERNSVSKSDRFKDIKF